MAPISIKSHHRIGQKWIWCNDFSVGCEGLDASWIGKILDNDSLEELVRLSNKYRFNVDGEGGEYETMVVSGPHFKGIINVNGSSNWDGRRGNLAILSIDSSFDG